MTKRGQLIVQVNSWQELSAGRLRGQRGYLRSGSSVGQAGCWLGGRAVLFCAEAQSGTRVGRLGEKTGRTDARCVGWRLESCEDRA